VISTKASRSHGSQGTPEAPPICRHGSQVLAGRGADLIGRSVSDEGIDQPVRTAIAEVLL
jgi:hypothetical protein